MTQTSRNPRQVRNRIDWNAWASDHRQRTLAEVDAAARAGTTARVGLVNADSSGRRTLDGHSLAEWDALINAGRRLSGRPPEHRPISGIFDGTAGRTSVGQRPSARAAKSRQLVAKVRGLQRDTQRQQRTTAEARARAELRVLRGGAGPGWFTL